MFLGPNRLKLGVQKFQTKYDLAPPDKAANTVVVVWRLHLVKTLKQELDGTKAYELQPLIGQRSVVNEYTYHSVTEFAVSVKWSFYVWMKFWLN